MTTEQLAAGGSYATHFDTTLEHVSGEPEWFLAQRREAFESFTAQGFPAPKNEDWRFTSVTPIADATFAAPSARKVSDADVKKHLYEELTGPRLVFVDGQYRPEFSKVDALPKGLTLCLLSEAFDKAPEIAGKYLGKLAENDRAPFTALGKALAQDGVFVHAARGAVLEETVQLLFITVGGETAEMHNTRSLFVFDENSQASFVETHIALGENTVFTNNVVETFVAENAHIDHYTTQQHNTQSFEITGDYLYQERSSTYRHHQFDFGGAIVRHNSWAKLDGDGCEATINGLYLIGGRQHVDNWMWVEHMKENIPSHEVFKGILQDHASASFCGRIYVHKEAQKTDAKQTNQNLLLSNDAKVNTKPQLEIYADDVKCTHGATIGQLDETALFYLMSRGIDREVARNILVHAFASDIVERVRIEPVRERIEGVINTRLPL